MTPAGRIGYGIQFNATTFEVLDVLRMFGVGDRGEMTFLNLPQDRDLLPPGVTRFENILYQFNPDTGEAISARYTVGGAIALFFEFSFERIS